MDGSRSLPSQGKFCQCFSTTSGPDLLPAPRVAQGDFPSWCPEDYHRGPSAADSAMFPALQLVLADFPSWYLAPQKGLEDYYRDLRYARYTTAYFPG
jgi:hypothetical protein